DRPCQPGGGAPPLVARGSHPRSCRKRAGLPFLAGVWKHPGPKSCPVRRDVSPAPLDTPGRSIAARRGPNRRTIRLSGAQNGGDGTGAGGGCGGGGRRPGSLVVVYWELVVFADRGRVGPPQFFFFFFLLTLLSATILPS